MLYRYNMMAELDSTMERVEMTRWMDGVSLGERQASTELGRRLVMEVIWDVM